MPLALQAKLLRVLQERRGARPSAAHGRARVDVRVVAATNRDLRRGVARGQLPRGPLYRLDVVSHPLPPLRERAGGHPRARRAPPLRGAARNPRRPSRGSRATALAGRCDHRWPGNVRELAHLIERLVLLARGEEATAADLPATLQSAAAPTRPPLSGDVVTMREMQRTYALWALEQVGGVRSRAAEKLDIDIKTLVKLIKGEPGDPPRS